MDKVIFSTAPVLKILKHLGVIPLFISTDEALKIFFNFIFAFILLLFWIFNFTVRFEAVEYLATNDAPITVVGFQLRLILPFALLAMLIVGGQIYRKKYQKIVTKIYQFDKKVVKVLNHFLRLTFSDLKLWH